MAVQGDVTNRRPGEPATDVLLKQAAENRFSTMVGYRTRLPDGRYMRSTTTIVHTADGTPAAALCINADLTVWDAVARIASSMTGSPDPIGTVTARPPVQPAPHDDAGEVFAHDVDELATHLIDQSIRAQGVPVELMRKEHKLAVVRDLKGRGLLLLRDAVEMIADALRVSRFTIYNYLNELAADADTTSPPAHRKKEE
ncbi:helix-turn-helix transcriptional regulator [Xylanimonas allomyrinae]|uniref:helix-turn-helix transcriptional regulator n=1 Tax=Xylanimonas allomyrinae TaxID=2509459 RepID=UPI001B886195|nr:helix-turn-helix domain-containing protein [Xylanimonas allomyrinae]